nr:venom protein [Lampona murina]
MHFVLFELAFIIPFCLGRIMENASSQEIEDKVAFSKDGTKRVLRPSLSIRNGPPKMLEMMAGEAKYLECEAGGSPPPTIHWLKDGKKIAQSFYEAIHPGENENEILPSHLGLGFTRSRLYVDCASARDAGKYTCVAENEYLRDSKSGQVFIVESLDGENNAICLAKKSFGSPARVHMWTHTRLEMMGTDVQLFCRPDGDPQPQVVWRGPGGAPLTNSQRYQVMDNGDLIIRNIEWSDMGGYTCRVKNSEGSDEILVFLYPTLPDNDKVSKA